MANGQVDANRLGEGVEFAKYALRRFGKDRCLRVAASLSYTSLLAMVPVIAIAFAVLAGIPAMEGMREQIFAFAFANFIPDTGEKVGEYLEGFVANAGRMTAVGVIGLSVVSLMLLATIEATLNIIFRVSQPRPLVPRLLVYWALLTLGPVLVGFSFSLATYLMTLKVGGSGVAGADFFSGLLGQLARGLPAVILIFTFSLIYMTVPNRPIRWSHALVGGIIAGLLFAGLRWGFGLYVIYFPAYKTLYGALAVVPIFLLWMYLSWAMVLFGGVVTASLSAWPAARVEGAEGQLGPVGKLLLASHILENLWQASQDGLTVRQKDLAKAVHSGGQALENILDTLRKAHFVTSSGRRWVLSRDLERVTLYDLATSLALDLDRDMPAVQRTLRGRDLPAWKGRLEGIISEATDGQRRAMDITLKELLTTPETEGALTAS